MRCKASLFALVFLTMMGCQTPVKVAGEEHRIAIEKWQALAKFSESSLVNYDVGITAQLALVSEKGYRSYKLTNITFSKTESNFNINLLAPFFKDKYVCTPVCDQLLEYVPASPNTGYTLLSQYFGRHEYELFEFYGDIYNLNKKVIELEAVEPSRVSAFLDYIVTAKTSHASLRAFSGYLSKRLSVAEYTGFLSNPPQPVSQTKTYAWYAEKYNFSGSHESDKWSFTFTNAESALWSASAEDESKKWQALESEMSIIASANFEGRAKVMDSEQAWLHAKNTVIDLDDLVCTYSDNIFGKVVGVSNNNITVALLGQAKLIKDGLITDPARGFLFGGKGEVSFMPLQGHKQLPHRELAICYAQ